MWSYIQRRRLKQQLKSDIAREFPSILTEKTSQGRRHYPPLLQWGQPRDAQRSEEDAERVESSGSGATADEKIVVRLTGDDDALDPRNWPLASRCKNIAILSLLIFVQGWTGGTESIANAAASQEFHVSSISENLSTSMYLWGVGTGALLAGPLSETVGRSTTYLASTFCYLFAILGCALTPSFAGQIVCRYLVGLFSSATLAINGGSVRDQFRAVKRAFVFPVVAWANVAAPIISPIASGWIISNPRLGWRWTDWISLIISGIAFIIAFLFLPETYLPLILDWKAKEIRHLTNDGRFASEHAESHSFFGRLKHTILLPATFFSSEPVITVLGLYLTLLYTLLFTFLSGFDYIFKETYQLSTGLTGSCFASIAAGATTFTLGAPGLYSWARRHTEYVHGASVEPEFRLWPAITAAPFLPICLFWLGWSNYGSLSIWSSLGACFIFGNVLIAIYVSSYEYIMDSYGEHAAIALASITMVRYLVAGGMVMATRPMYTGIGVHWTLTLLGCLALILTPAPFLFWKYGRRIRARSP